jgi:integrase
LECQPVINLTNQKPSQCARILQLQAIARKKPVIQLSVFWEKQYLPWGKENKKSWQADKSFYEHCIKPVLGNKTLDAISPFDIERLYSSMKKATTRLGNPYSEKSMKHVVVLLSRLYVLAGNWGKYKGENPCLKVKKPRPNNKITESLSDDEMKNLNEVINAYSDRVIACLVKFATVTGLRRGELLKLRWQDVDIKRKQMVLIDSKGKVNQALPLQKDFRFHGLRHNFASHLVSSGTDLYTVSKLLTHKSMAVTQRYAHLADKHLREAANKAGGLLIERQEKEAEKKIA